MKIHTIAGEADISIEMLAAYGAIAIELDSTPTRFSVKYVEGAIYVSDGFGRIRIAPDLRGRGYRISVCLYNSDRNRADTIFNIDRLIDEVRMELKHRENA